MKTYFYKAKEGPQKVIEGRMEAQNRDQVAARLTGQGLYPLEIVPVSSPAGLKKWNFSWSRPELAARDKISLIDQLADLSHAGMSIMKALEIVSKQEGRPERSALITTLKETIHGGRSFSEGLEKYPASFNRFAVNMIRSGEQTGTFDQACRRLAQAWEKEQDLKTKVRQALLYPSAVLGFGIVTVIVLLVFVVPRLENLYQDFGTTLPWFTRMVLAVSRFLAMFGWVLLLAAGALIWFLKRRSPDGRVGFRAALLRVPWIGPLLRLEETAHFTRTLSLLLKGGVPIIEALGAAGEIVREKQLGERIEQARAAVVQGESLAKAMEHTGAFDALTVGFVQTGEETGRLDDSLEKVSSLYEKHIDERLKVLTTMLEPLLILGVGSIVGVIVVSMLLPIFQISLLAY
ncbi:MAG: type II secretion system F family protein [Candidatus Omnitrophica bacterium]|nr:type II secretion system F family protein [Candidatus Omnitrophota bacterium]